MELEPQYFGQNIIRYENFISDLNILMTDTDLNWKLTEALSYLIKKYELINFCYFNEEAYSFIFTVFHKYYKKYLYMVNEKKGNIGELSEDMNLLLEFKKGKE